MVRQTKSMWKMDADRMYGAVEVDKYREMAGILADGVILALFQQTGQGKS